MTPAEMIEVPAHVGGTSISHRLGTSQYSTSVACRCELPVAWA
jgi:hypothetical protein